MSPAFKELLKHKLVLGSLAVVALILAGSLAYYFIATARPALSYAPVVRGALSEDVAASGTVEPLENPTLSFVTGGKVTSVAAVVGRRVGAGTLLASLDTGILSANLAAAKAGLASAESSLSNSVETVPDAIASAEAQAESAVSTDTGYLFGNYTPTGRSPRFTSDDTDARNRLEKERADVEDAIAAWQEDDRTLAALSDSAGAAMLDTDLARLAAIRAYLRDLDAALAGAEPASFSGDVTVSEARASADSANAAITSAIATLTSKKQSLSTNASGAPTASAAAIAGARAQVDAAAAALAQAEIVAPFGGTVASVSVKPGDIIAPNAPAITLVPDGAFEVPVYVTELDVAALKEGNRADVTLDAYGAARTFGASVTSIDASPSAPPAGGAPAYKVVLAFDSADPAILNGMHANAVVHAGSKTDALLVPRSALIEEGSSVSVLKETPQGPVKTPVTLGLVGETEAEIVAGVAEGDQVATVGGK